MVLSLLLAAILHRVSESAANSGVFTIPPQISRAMLKECQSVTGTEHLPIRGAVPRVLFLTPHPSSPRGHLTAQSVKQAKRFDQRASLKALPCRSGLPFPWQGAVSASATLVLTCQITTLHVPWENRQPLKLGSFSCGMCFLKGTDGNSPT